MGNKLAMVVAPTKDGLLEYIDNVTAIFSNYDMSKVKAMAFLVNSFDTMLVTILSHRERLKAINEIINDSDIPVNITATLSINTLTLNDQYMIVIKFLDAELYEQAIFELKMKGVIK